MNLGPFIFNRFFPLTESKYKKFQPTNFHLFVPFISKPQQETFSHSSQQFSSTSSFKKHSHHGTLNLYPPLFFHPFIYLCSNALQNLSIFRSIFHKFNSPKIILTDPIFLPSPIQFNLNLLSQFYCLYILVHFLLLSIIQL